MTKRVVVTQRRMTHYRVPFFESLRQHFAQYELELVLAYGRGTPQEESKDDSAEIEWGYPLTTIYWSDGRICYQPLGGVTKGAEMLVIALENKLICNLWHQFSPVSCRIGLWGHGANLQGDPSSLRERFKRQIAKRADWWFGYTGMSLPLIERSGFPKDRITILNNSVDTKLLAAMRQNIELADLNCLTAEFELLGNQVGVFVGSLYAEKRIDFMLEAAEKIHAALPKFVFLIIGSGPMQAMVEAFCQKNNWAKYIGVRKGQDKVNVLAMCSVMINPGLVGLGILDSFVCGVPMVTTDCGLHSPEIAYLKNGENGLMTSNSIDDYVAAVVVLLSDEAAIAKLQAGCVASAREYTVENMARNFTDGVMRCLEAPIYRGRGTA
jgi:L-malate glycosyltransferase